MAVFRAPPVLNHRVIAAGVSLTRFTQTGTRPIKTTDAFKFNGAAPEIVNGRLAMAALLYVARREAESGETALALLTAPAAWYEYAWVALVVYASMVPILKGARHESFFAFSTRAEFANGRAAMLGWAALLLLERQAGVPFF